MSQRLATEHDNPRSASGWATSSSDGAVLLSLATAREAAGPPAPPADLPQYGRDVNGVREGLGESSFTRHHDAGRVAAVDDIVRRHALPPH